MIGNALFIGIGILTLAGLAAIGAAILVLHRRAERALETVQRLRSLLDLLEEGVAVCSGMQVIAANISLCHLIGVEGETDLLLSSFVTDADVIDRLLVGSETRLETELRKRDGASVAVEVSARTVDYGGTTRRLLEFRDIGERRDTERRASFLAQHDPLTSLPNREVMRTRLAEMVGRARSANQHGAVIWVDLDRFKEINDVNGHVVGDQILREVAEKLKFELPADTVISRIGGDEFIVVCEAIRDAGEARMIGQQLRRMLNRPFNFGSIVVNVGASIGVAVFPDHGDNADDLLKNADLALYHAKQEGRARCRPYTDALGRERQRRAALGRELRSAIEQGTIEAHFQPLVRVSDLRAVGFETLARWFHPEFGAVPPFEFVRIAEENGLITPLTDLIMSKAIAAARQWPDHVRVSVNVSPVQINSDLVDQVRNKLKASGLDPRRLELEVTEDVLIKDFEQTASMFARLRSLGVQVAMDDFGSGFTSLGNLRRLNFERLKIDRIFTMDLPDHRRSAAIVRSMFVLARELNLDVTVEGVETAEQFAWLSAEGCSEVQGFLFSKPQPLSAFSDPASLQFAPPSPAPPTSVATLVEIAGHRAKRAS